MMSRASVLALVVHAQEQFLERQLVPVPIESTSCIEHCEGQGKTGAYIKGDSSGPFCNGDCNDCGRDICGPKKGFFSESGSECLTGSQQCCCYDKQEACSSVSPSPHDEVPVPQDAENGQCATSWWMGCCKIGKVCDCSKSSGASGQCSWLAYHGCCSVGTPCDCSTPPVPGTTACKIIQPVCKKIFSHPAATKEACALDAAETAAACEAFGLGPEDPLADVCAFVLGGAVGAACEALVAKGLQFGAEKCEEIAGCTPTTLTEFTSSFPEIANDITGTSLAEIARDANKNPAPICGIVDNVCSSLFKDDAKNTRDCAVAEKWGLAACSELSAEKSLTDACKYAVGGTVGGACATRVREGLAFRVQDCKAAAGCTVPTDQWFREIETDTHDEGSSKCTKHDCAVGWSGSTCTVPCDLSVTIDSPEEPATFIEQCAMGSYTVTAEPFDDVPVWKQKSCGVSHIIFRYGKNWYLGYGDEHERPVVGAVYRSTTGDANTHVPWADMGWEHMAVVQNCRGLGVGFSCSDMCKDGGHGSIGTIQGNAPFCDGGCSDCNGGKCYEATSAMSDYGHGCVTGHKVCCCSQP